MPSIPSALREVVQARAGFRCEYCGIPGKFGIPAHQPDHIISVQHGGTHESENLAFACAHCNRYKGPNLSGRDPITGQILVLFNPRTDPWNEHFEWDNVLLRGRTALGRATVHTLNMNHPLRLAFRRALRDEGVVFAYVS